MSKGKLRSVNMHFWNDNYIVDLDPIEKLLFLYLLTNPNTNMLGVYELHIRRISFDTGIDKDMIIKIFDRFKDAGKASYIDGFVCLHNFTKHQAYNSNMKVSAVNSYNELPETVKKQRFIKEALKALEPFTKGSEPIAEIEREIEEEIEKEVQEERDPPETKKSSLPNTDYVPPTMEQIMAYAGVHFIPEKTAQEFFWHYDSLGWENNYGRPIKNWVSLLNKWNSKQPQFEIKKSNNNHHGKPDEQRIKDQLARLNYEK